MKRNFLLLINLIFFYNSLSAQVCGNDSVIKHFYSLREDYTSVELTLYTDSFDLSRGMKYQSTINDANTDYSVRFDTSMTFIRNLISYNSFHDTIIFQRMQGTGSGYVNLEKTEFTYTAGEQLLSRTRSLWNGTSWNIFETENRIYNSSDQITSDVLGNSSGNIFRKIFTYNGLQQSTILFQTDSAGLWKNDYEYSFIYNASGAKDSVFIKAWDDQNSQWIDSLKAAFNMQFVAPLELKIVNGTDTTETFYYLDTLNNVIRFTSTSYFEEQEKVWSYFNNHFKKISESYSSDYQQSETWGYNIYGIISGYGSSYRSSISGGSSGESYDTSGNIFSETSDYTQLCCGSHHSVDRFYYASADHLILNYVPVADERSPLCQGDSIRAIPLVAGGCGPYRFHWTPIAHISSDTIKNPLVFLTNPEQYHITVTDSTGHTAATDLLTDVDYSLAISVDTTFCSGCPVILSAIPDYYSSYRWYRNDTLIDNADSDTFTAATGGSYTVESDGVCTIISDPVEINITERTRLRGHVFLDRDSDCVFNNNDLNLFRIGNQPVLIRIQRDISSPSVYINTDSAGKYDVPVDTGSFRVSIVNSSALFSYSCPDTGTVIVNILSVGDTLNGVDFALKPLMNCHKLHVTVSSSRYRPCQHTVIDVQYYNEGTFDEPNPVVTLRLPPELINIQSVYPFTMLPNGAFQFLLPSLSIGMGASFAVSADVVCDPASLSNATLCIDADISPVSFCSFSPDSMWDGNYVRVFSHCGNDSACFTIYDISENGIDMDTSSQWNLFADDILISSGTFRLNAGGDTTLCFAGGGRTLRMEINQTHEFPVPVNNNASIERCGLIPAGGNYSVNRILTSSIDNRVPFHFTYCAGVFNSSDPNSKSVSPQGLGALHMIDPDNRVVYRIDFQNTGNDTAFHVKIVDPLDQQFNLSTLQLISSSHPFTFLIDNNNLIWNFNNILLPDSNVNEFASHGYVEFSVKLNDISIPVTHVFNLAKIYFDNNLPVVTNSVNNTFCLSGYPEIIIQPVSEFCSDSLTLASHLNYPGDSPVIKWFVNGLFQNQGDSVILYNITQGDTISAILQSNYVCRLSDTAFSNHFIISISLPTITYTAQGLMASGGVAYQWYLDSLPLPGATAQSLLPLADGNYQVEVTNTDGCPRRSLPYYFVSLNVTNVVEGELVIYPNPAMNSFTIYSPLSNNTIVIRDINGKIIDEFIKHEKVIPVTLSDETPDGIYFVTLSSGNSIFTGTIIINHFK